MKKMRCSEKPKLLELFASSRSVGKVAEEKGFEVFSVDWEEREGISLVKDIEHLSPKEIPFVPDVVWASPDCTTYTIAAISTHRNGTEPKSDYAKKCDAVNTHFIDIIDHYLSINPNMIFYIENPRGMLRKMPFMQRFPRVTVWYCTYGDTRAKPTDIWSNNIRSLFNPEGTWIPRPECFNGNENCHHERAPRGSQTGTQGLSNAFERSRVPKRLCQDAMEAVLIHLNNQVKT